MFCPFLADVNSGISFCEGRGCRNARFVKVDVAEIGAGGAGEWEEPINSCGCVEPHIGFASLLCSCPVRGPLIRCASVLL